MQFVLYKAWVLKNGSLEHAAYVDFISIQFSAHGICSPLMRLVDGGLECKVCNLCCIKHVSLRMAL